MTTGKKVLLGIAIALALPILGFLVFCMDESPPNDSGLRLVRQDIPESEDGFTYVHQAAKKLDLPKEDEESPPDFKPPKRLKPPCGSYAVEPPRTKKERWDAALGGEFEWDQAIVDEVLARNVEALALWEQGLAKDRFQAPLPLDVEGFLLPDWPYPCLSIAGVVTVSATLAARRGEYNSAFEDVVKLVRFGHQVMGAKGSLVSFTIGSTIKGMGYGLAWQHVGKCTLSAAQLRTFAAELAKYPDDTGHLIDALRVEYAFNDQVIRSIQAGDLEGISKDKRLKRLTEADRWKWTHLPNPFFKPNRTRRHFVELFGYAAANAPRLPKDRTDLGNLLERSYAEATLWRGNIIGEELIRVLTPAVGSLPVLVDRSRAELGVTRIMLAMKAFKLDNGRPPQTLDELVPNYLDAVPRDCFDGKPLRWNPAKKLIYSVGKDLKDDGGMTQQEYVEAEMKERGLDPKTVDPKEVEFIEGCFPWWAPNPSFPIDF
ncbi:MAG: hypothetical protein NTX87_13725 [Planctomycetota bacterium]|nr:hypothetical protein [Planctomycetota bacterium]